jgi:hypothetical protein
MRNSVSRPWLLSFGNMKKHCHSWKLKVHPLFLEGAGVYRKGVSTLLALGPHPPGEKVALLDARFREEIGAIRARYSGAQYTPTADDPLAIIFVSLGPFSWPPSQREMNAGFLELLYWKRFKEPLWIALQKADAGDLDAFRRVNRVGEDYLRLRSGNGPIKPAKGDPDHAALIGFGLDMGLSNLTAEELADCFDMVCPCRKSHDADALKKQRSRIQKAIQKARQWLAADRAKMSTREWMCAYGKNELFAKGTPSIEGHPPERRVYVGEIGKQVVGYVNDRGNVVVLKGLRLDRRSTLRNLPAAFEVRTTTELFEIVLPPIMSEQPERGK